MGWEELAVSFLHFAEVVRLGASAYVVVHFFWFKNFKTSQFDFYFPFISDYGNTY